MSTGATPRERAHAALADLVPSGRQFIGGAWIEPSSGEGLDAVDPSTGKIVHSVAGGGEVDIDRAVAAAGAAGEGEWGRAAPFDRARILRAIAGAIADSEEELTLLESLDAGKPIPDARGDVGYAAECFDYFASLAIQIDGTTRHLDNGLALIRREPVGTVGVITPFNYPLALSSVKIAAALAAGCTVVHKPSEHTPLSALALARIAEEAGLPAGAYNVVNGTGADAGGALVRHPGVAKIVFTGSTAVGTAVAAQAAGALKRVTMELGGKSANIVCADADLADTGPRSHLAYTMNAGQYCESGSRLFVERSIHDELAESLARQARETVVGDALDPATQLGPLISQAAATRVHGLIERGLEAGATLVAGGEPGPGGSYYPPTVIAGAEHDSELVQDEIFGPVVALLPFDDVEDAIRLANSSRFGLAAGIQTGDLARGLRIAERLQAGTVWVNDWAAGNVTIPVGGVKLSGLGREQGPEGLAEFLEYKSVLASL